MKEFLFASLLFVSCSGFSQSTVSPQEEKAIKQLITDTFQDILSDFDTTKIEVHCTKDFLLLEHGEVWNNDTIRNYMRKALEREDRPVRTNKFEFIQFEKSGNMIWVAYKNWASWSKNDSIVAKRYWLESAAAIKQGKNWKLQMLHSTRIEDE